MLLALEDSHFILLFKLLFDQFLLILCIFFEIILAGFDHLTDEVELYITSLEHLGEVLPFKFKQVSRGVGRHVKSDTVYLRAAVESENKQDESFRLQQQADGFFSL